MDKTDILNVSNYFIDLYNNAEAMFNTLTLSKDDIIDIQNNGVNLTRILNLFDGTPFAIVKFVYSVKNTIQTMKDQIFINKFNMFLAGTLIKEKDHDMLIQQLSQYGDPTENAFRIVSCVDKVETTRKGNILSMLLCVCSTKKSHWSNISVYCIISKTLSMRIWLTWQITLIDRICPTIQIYKAYILQA